MKSRFVSVFLHKWLLRTCLDFCGLSRKLTLGLFSLPEFLQGRAGNVTSEIHFQFLYLSAVLILKHMIKYWVLFVSVVHFMTFIISNWYLWANYCLVTSYKLIYLEISGLKGVSFLQLWLGNALGSN